MVIPSLQNDFEDLKMTDGIKTIFHKCFEQTDVPWAKFVFCRSLALKLLAQVL